MNAEQKMSTIRQDVFAVYKRVERARGLVSMVEQPEVWRELDMAIARLQGLTLPWPTDPQARNGVVSEVEQPTTVGGVSL